MIVTVDAIFSKKNLIGSKLIALGTKHLVSEIKDTPSHTALLVNNRWVHESTGHTGVRVISYTEWSKINKEVARVKLKSIAYQKLADLFRDIKGKKYDFLGVLFLGICIGLTFFGIKLPKRNILESKNKYFCCEALGYLTNHYYGMSAPVQILQKLQG